MLWKKGKRGCYLGWGFREDFSEEETLRRHLKKDRSLHLGTERIFQAEETEYAQARRGEKT